MEDVGPKLADILVVLNLLFTECSNLSHRIFRPSNTFHKEILIKLHLIVLSYVFYIKIKAFLVILREFQSVFLKTHILLSNFP